MILTKKPMRTAQVNGSGSQSQSQNSDVTPTFSSLPSLMDEFFSHDPLFKWGTDWMTDFNSGRSLGTSLPAVNIRETNDEFVLEVAAPGMSKQNFRVECSGNQLTISYQQQQENTNGSQNTDYWRREFNFESFQRSFQLPETANSEKVDARYVDGILTVTVAKKEEARNQPARTISIS
jgi:HSP20 family protein